MKAGTVSAQHLAGIDADRPELAELPAGDAWEDPTDFHRAGGDLRSWVRWILATGEARP